MRHGCPSALLHACAHARPALQEIGWFDEEGNSSGTLTSKLATDAAHIRGAVADTVGLFFQNAVTLVSGYALALA